MAINIKTDNLIYPYFVVEGKNKREQIESFPGVYRLSVDQLLEDIREALRLGIGKVLLFGLPSQKDIYGECAYEPDNIIGKTVREIKKEFPRLIVFTDVCLCAYTTYGHCGIIRGRRASCVLRRASKNTKYKITNYDFIDNDATLEVLAKIALMHAQAGADWVAPSAMAKNQVRLIRQALDKNGFKKTKILGYSAKFASNFYGPFREAARSAPQFGDRRAYQLDFQDDNVALAEIKDDIREGADMVMVKPALAYLDIIAKAKERLNFPLAAYNVSGEYAMVKAHCQGSGFRVQGSEIEKKIVLEIITGIKRAGADFIITYHAKEIAKWLKNF